MAVQSRAAHLTGMLGSGPSTGTVYLRANYQEEICYNSKNSFQMATKIDGIVDGRCL